MNKKSKSSKRWEHFKLRSQLLWIWVLKNLSLFIKVTIITIAILVATNVIGSEDFLVQLLHFDELETINWASVKGIENALAVIISAIITALLFIKKTKHLALEDIKSRDLKIALIKAHLYFDENGKLCKRIEELTDLDLNDDEKIGDTQISQTKDPNIINGIGQAVSELKTVLTVDLDQDEEKVIEEEQLHDEIEEDVEIGLSDENGKELLNEEQKNNESIEKPKKPNIFVTSWNKIVLSSKSFWNNLKISLSSLKDPKLDDGMDSKKPKKVKEKKKKNKQEQIEIIDIENQETELLETEDSSKINDENNNSEINKEVAEQSQEKKNQSKTAAPRITSKKQQIDDILAGLK